MDARHRYVDTERELRELDAKAMTCPHCGLYGTLNAHGWLRGYAEIGSGRVVRGRRWYCSNRFRRPGCGRTWSVLLSHVIAGFTVTTTTLARFVGAVVGGACRSAAWRGVQSGMTLSSGYRLWRRIDRAQPALRTLLSRGSPPPASTSALPMAELVGHLNAALSSEECVLGHFQLRFQRGLFD